MSRHGLAHGAAPDEPAALRVAPTLPRDQRAATLLFFDAYRQDPTFALLYGSTSGPELDGTLPIFEWIQAASSAAGTMLGCYRADWLVGVVAYLPDRKPSFRDPISAAFGCLLRAYWAVRYRPRLGAAARARWRAYGHLADAQNPPRPALRILALGVAEGFRRQGIARLLLEAVRRDERWRTSIDCIQVETWHASKVSIYEHLGFETLAHGTRDGVHCWTMLRPTGRSAEGRSS